MAEKGFASEPGTRTTADCPINKDCHTDDPSDKVHIDTLSLMQKRGNLVHLKPVPPISLANCSLDLSSYFAPDDIPSGDSKPSVQRQDAPASSKQEIGTQTNVQSKEGQKSNDNKVNGDKQRYPGEALFDIEKISMISRVSITDKGVNLEEPIELKPGETLPKGNYKIFWKIGKNPQTGEDIERAALLHIPEGKDLGMIVLVPGVSNKDQLSENYLMETHLHELADQGEEKYVVLTLLTEKREIGPESKAKGIRSSAWVTDGCFLHPEVVSQLRKENKERTGVAYDDRDYVAGILRTAERLAPISSDRNMRGFVGGSQGGALISRLCGDSRFQGIANVYVVGSSAEAEAKDLNLPEDNFKVQPYRIEADNAQHVLIFQHRNDTLALPHPDKLNLVKAALTIPFLHSKAVVLGLGAFDNLHQNPLKLESIYLRDLDIRLHRNLGDSEQYRVTAYTPEDALEKLKTRRSFNHELKTPKELDEARKQVNSALLYSYYFKDGPNKGLTVDVYDLPIDHVFAGRRRGSTSAYTKSEEYDEGQIIDDDMEAQIAKRRIKPRK